MISFVFHRVQAAIDDQCAFDEKYRFYVLSSTMMCKYVRNGKGQGPIFIHPMSGFEIYVALPYFS
jgi:hypothetical protein